MPGFCATKLTVLSVAAGFVICLTVTADGQAVITRPELLSGPWELASPSGVDGIFVRVYQAIDRDDRRTIRRQTIHVRVFNRRDGHETRRSYAVSPGPDSTVMFDGKRLRVPGLAAAFDQDAARWIGTWLVDGQMRDIVLERPHPAKGVTPNPLCGDWEGLPDALPGPTTVRLHVLQSSDGTFSGWMDVLSVVQDQSYGLSLKVIAADPTNVILQNESPSFSFYSQFSGDLSSDRNSMAGRWNSRPARWTFRRIR